MCAHGLRNYGLVLNPACPSLIFSSFSNSVPILSFKIVQHVLHYPSAVPRVSLVSFFEFYYYSFSPSLGRVLVLPYPLHNIIIMVSITSPPCFINLFTILSAPAAFSVDMRGGVNDERAAVG